MIGFAAIGDAAFGSGPPAHGEAASVTAMSTVPGVIHVEWTFVGPEDDDAVTLVYVDGALAARILPPATAADVVAPAASTARVDVVSWPRYTAVPDTSGGGAVSSRARLRWPRVAGAQAYRVYKSGTLTDTLDTPALQTGETVLGSGVTVTVSGSIAGYTDAALSATCASGVVTITDGTASQSVTVTGAQTVRVFGGVFLAFSGVPADTDTFSIIVCPPLSYTTAPLASGTHSYTVTALDAAGNESVAAGPVSVVIAAPASPLTNAALAYSDATGNVTLTATAPAGTASVAVYDNRHDLSALPNMDAPAVSQAVTPGAVSVTVCAAAGKTGVLRVIARAVTAGGVDDGTSEPLTITLPYVADLPTPQNLVATPTAGGALSLAWRAAVTATDTAGWRATVNGGSAVTLTVTASAVQGDTRIGYAAALTAGQCGAAGAKTVVVYPVTSGGRAGASATATATTDATGLSAPASLSAEVL